MKRNRTILCAVAMLSLTFAGCAGQQVITANPSGPGNPVVEAVASAAPDVTTDFQNAEYNLDQAIAIGVLPANDPADACVHSALQAAGIEGANGQPVTPGATNSFTAKTSLLVSQGSVLYIRLQQANASAGSIAALNSPNQCDAIIGYISRQALLAKGAVAALVIAK